jgi:hypothetical protein
LWEKVARAERETVEGFLAAGAPSSGALRHLLPQGEKVIPPAGEILGGVEMSDLALKNLGVACAVASTWFAAHMLTHQGPPRVNAIEDFAIFAQPNRMQAVESALRATGLKGGAIRTNGAVAIDMTPIGVTREDEKPDAARRDVRIVELNGEGALIETTDGFRRVKAGDELPDIGKVISVRRMGDYWVLVASQRSLAQAVPPGAPPEP